jgi:hypothetical protein
MLGVCGLKVGPVLDNDADGVIALMARDAVVVLTGRQRLGWTANALPSPVWDDCS